MSATYWVCLQRLPEKLGCANYPQEEPEREASALLDLDSRLWECGAWASIHRYQGDPKQSAGRSHFLSKTVAKGRGSLSSRGCLVL